jgi:hypothetical protein
LTHSSRRLNSRQKAVREREGGEERKETMSERKKEAMLKKSSSFVCQSFYDRHSTVIRIYIHYRASECMTSMYLHLNSECTCNLSCTIDLMMWLYSKSVRPSFLDICSFPSIVCFLFSLLFLTQFIIILVERDRKRYHNNH